MAPMGALAMPRGSEMEGAHGGAAEGAHGGKGRVLPPPLRGTPLPEGGIMAEDAMTLSQRAVAPDPNVGPPSQNAVAPGQNTMTPRPNAMVAKACGEAGKILVTLRKRNGKKGRIMGRSMGALDEILHGKLKLLHIPRSA